MATLFLCGDVMTGRGIEQILAHPCPPWIQEPYVLDRVRPDGMLTRHSMVAPRR